MPSVSRGATPVLNSTCDPVLIKFYDQVLASIRGVQRSITRLLSLHSSTDLLESPTYLRRFYGYVSGLSSGLECPARYYASSLRACKHWAVQNCRVRSPHETAWLRERYKWSNIACHMGLEGIPRLIYKAFGWTCDDSPNLSGLFSTLRGFANGMGISHKMTKLLNGKVTYVIKTTDLLNSKLKQVISSLREMSGTFQDWKSRYNAYLKQEYCHFNLNQEFISLYSLELNKAFSGLLRLGEIDDLVHPSIHPYLSRKTLIGFPDLPRFLAADLELRFSRSSSLSSSIATLRSGFPLMIIIN